MSERKTERKMSEKNVKKMNINHFFKDKNGIMKQKHH